MAKRKPGKDLTKIDAPTLPAYLQNEAEGDESLDTMQEFRVIPRIKIIQALASTELLELFDAGDIIVSPLNQMICKHEKGEDKFFSIVPLLFYPEWCKWSDRKDSDAAAILERSFDVTSEVAKKSKDARTRFEGYGGTKEDGGYKLHARYVEHLNFIVVIYDPSHELHMETLALSYSRGEYYAGANLCSAASTRGAVGARAPLWSQVWDLVPKYRVRGENKWWGMDHCTPELDEDENSRAFITEEEVPVFKELHEQMFEMHSKRLIVVDHSGGDDEEEPSDDDAESKY